MSEKLSEITEEATSVGSTDRMYIVQGGVSKYIDGDTLNEIYGLPHKRYKALLTQSGTDDPVATILENTLGNIVWSRALEGQYQGTLTGVFLEDKTAVYPIQTYVSLSDSKSIIYRSDDNTISIETSSSGSLSDDELIKNLVLIEVYP